MAFSFALKKEIFLEICPIIEWQKLFLFSIIEAKCINAHTSRIQQGRSKAR